MELCDYIEAPEEAVDVFVLQKFAQQNRPMSIHFELTQRCNLRCVHCLFPHEIEDELSTSELIDAFEQLKHAGVFALSLSGGEVFSRPDIHDILDYFLENRFMIAIFTNGTLVDDKIIEKLKKIPMRQIEISIYGSTADVHDAITTRKGSFEKSINTIKALRDAGLRVLMKPFLLGANFHQRHEMVKLAEELGVRHASDFNLMPMVTSDTSVLAKGITLEQLAQLYNEVNTGGLILRNDAEIVDKSSQLPSGNRVICNTGRVNGCISANGDVMPCPTLRYKMGNLREKPFLEIWHSDVIDGIRYMAVDDLKECKTCDIVEYCNRCPGIAYLETGDYLSPAPASVCSKYKYLTNVGEEGGLF